MKAVLCGPPDSGFATLGLRDCPIPVPGPGQVRIRTIAASLNPVDWKLASGFLPWWQGIDARVVGLDGAGVIEALGPDAGGWQVGDRVMWHGDLNRDGVLAEFALADAHVLSRIPDDVSFEAAAALPCAGLTAWQALVRKARVGAGDVVLVQGASGAVGGFGVQIARHFGARVIALAREAEHDRIRDLGADHVFPRDLPDLRDRVRDLTGGYGADIMLEVVRAPDARQSLDLIRYNGQLLCVDPMPDLSQVPAYHYAASIHEVALGGAYAAGHLPTQRDFSVMGAELLALVESGRMVPMISRVVPLTGAVEALRTMRDRAEGGKIVVRVGDPA